MRVRPELDGRTSDPPPADDTWSGEPHDHLRQPAGDEAAVADFVATANHLADAIPAVPELRDRRRRGAPGTRMASVQSDARYHASDKRPRAARNGSRSTNADFGVLRNVNQSLEQQAKRIAQALHDESGQLLAAAHIALAEAARNVPPPARAHLQTVSSHLNGIEEQLRRLAHELRPRILDDCGLVPAIEFLSDGFAKRHSIPVSVHAAVNRLPSMIETTIYRVVQEALTNIATHARATHVDIRLLQTPRTFLCSIADDGVGLEAVARPRSGGERGFGLAGARDQVAALGGTMSINSARGTGLELAIMIPLDE